MEAHGNVRWDGTLKRPLTPSTARDMANRVVGRQKNQVPCFCALEMAKKERILGGGPTSMLEVIVQSFVSFLAQSIVVTVPIFVIVITPSVSMFVGQGLSLDARRAAQAERQAANAAVVAPPAAERPSSAAPPPLAPLVLSPPGKLLTSRGNRWILADDDDVPPPPRSDVSAGGGSSRTTTMHNQAPLSRPGTSPPIRSSRTTALGRDRRTLLHC